VDFIDALNACIARESGIRDIITYDEHFKKIEFVNKIEPQEL
jgi:predicted nucleic acid-binding protein